MDNLNVSESGDHVSPAEIGHDQWAEKGMSEDGLIKILKEVLKSSGK